MIIKNDFSHDQDVLVLTCFFLKSEESLKGITQALVYAACFAKFMADMNSYEASIVVNVILTNGRKAWWLKVLFNHYDFTTIPDDMDDNNYYCVKGPYGLFNSNKDLNIEFFEFLRYLCHHQALRYNQK